jgi:hypothetical protein
LRVALVGVVLGAKRNGPQDGMAVGCLWIVILCVAGVLGLLALGVGMGWGWLVRVISFGAMGIALLAVPQALWAGMKGKGRWR